MRELSRQRNTSNRNNDLHQIQHIIVSLSNSGLAIFHKSFSSVKIDPDLFSALFTAVSMMNRIYVGQGEAYEVLQFDKWTAKICQGQYLTGIILSDIAVVDEIVGRLERFVLAFEHEYGFLLHNWHGDRTFFDHDWANFQLMECLVSNESNYRLNDRAIRLLENARQIRVFQLIRRYAGGTYFRIEALADRLVSELDISKGHAMDYLSELIENEIIIPIEGK
ncbi:MAG: hypothetical protein ACFFD3_13675 [Candidatus Thorarchaeota archaeon]